MSAARQVPTAPGVPSPEPLVSMTGISKSFGRVQVLFGVDFAVRPGEVHVLAGENGAGKSTLIRILAGVLAADEGTVCLHGRRVCFRSPREAADAGIALIHQELSLIRSMSVADNIMLGREPGRGGWLDRRRQNDAARAALARLGLELDVSRPAGTLPISLQQMIEIAKALAGRADLIIMDEPTSALNEPEVERLFATIRELRARGCGLVYITHKLEEVYQIADRITVLRDGCWVTTAPPERLPAEELIRHMVGRELVESDDGPVGPDATATDRLEVAGLTVHARHRARPLVDDINLSVRGGEILGLAGLQGSGNSELLGALFGAYGRRVRGRMAIDGQTYRPRDPRHAVRCGLALATNDRQRSGLVLGLSVAANVTLAALARVSPGGWLCRSRESDLVHELATALDLRAASPAQRVGALSGGNQQKVVLAKWLCTTPRVLLLDEPTRGVDVGAKAEIYRLLRTCRQAGLAILLITSEMPELLRMSDRILVMHRGRAAAWFARGQATPQAILHAAMGGSPGVA